MHWGWTKTVVILAVVGALFRFAHIPGGEMAFTRAFAPMIVYALILSPIALILDIRAYFQWKRGHRALGSNKNPPTLLLRLLRSAIARRQTL